MKVIDKEGTVIVNGAKIYYRTVGKGVPLVMLHGNGEDHKAFKNQISFFKNEYRLILIDSRGHGKSAAGEQELNFKLMAYDVLKILDNLDVTKAVFLGFSDGANLAIQFTVCYPQRVKALIAVSGNIRPEGLKQWFYWLTNLQYRFLSIMSKRNHSLLLKKQLVGLMALHPHLTKKELKKISVPALILAGEKDIIRRSHTQEIASCIKGARLCIIPKANHMSIYENPMSYNWRIKDFLRESKVKMDSLFI